METELQAYKIHAEFSRKNKLAVLCLKLGMKI